MFRSVRNGIVILVVSVALLAAVGGAGAATRRSLPARAASAGAAGLALQVLDDVNQIRAQHDLAPLRLSPSLTTAAGQHAGEMAKDGYFAHESVDGSPVWKRVQRYYGASGFGYWSVGENLLWSSPDVDAAQAVQMWMASPEHRANLLAPRWREIGLATVHATAAPGVYHGLDVTIVAADFGVRSELLSEG